MSSKRNPCSLKRLRRQGVETRFSLCHTSTFVAGRGVGRPYNRMSSVHEGLWSFFFSSVLKFINLQMYHQYATIRGSFILCIIRPSFPSKQVNKSAQLTSS